MIEKIDFNDDGFLDLVVGAPLYYKSQHGSNDGIEGAVYIYLNDGSGIFSPNSLPNWIKMGAKGSRFGAVVKNIGDINLDNIDDLAVSSPGENKVYIFHGDKRDGLGADLIPAQILEPKSTNFEATNQKSEFLSFGYSIAAADFDENKYSDIAVGSLKGGVSVFRSRPIIDILVKLKFENGKINLKKDLSSKVSVCFGFTERSNSIRDQIKV